MTETIRPGALYLVSTPIGHLDDITTRAVRILREVDLVAAEDTRTTGVLLRHLGIHTPLMSYHDHNEQKRVPGLITRLRGGAAVAVVTDAGTPGIADPAFLIVREAIRAGITVIPVPGASALLAALVVSGLPMERFAFEGFLPAKKGRRTRLTALQGEERTMVLYEAPHRIERTVRDLLAALGDRPAALAREITKKFEEHVRGSLSEILDTLGRTTPRGEYVLVVGGKNDRGNDARDDSSSEEEAHGRKEERDPEPAAVG